jgi:hypothetical protein
MAAQDDCEQGGRDGEHPSLLAKGEERAALFPGRDAIEISRVRVAEGFVMKTAELTGEQLNHWTAKALGWEQRLWGAIPIWYDPKNDNRYRCDVSRWNPSEDWSQGGPILDFMKPFWLAWAEDGIGNDYVTYLQPNIMEAGPTILVAALRAFVASKYGDDVPA